MPEKFRSLTPREKVLISLLILLTIFFGFYRLVLQQQITTYQDNQAQLSETHRELATARAITAQEKAGREMARGVEKNLNTVLPAFNTQMQSGSALVDLAWKAYNKQVFLEEVKPMPLVEKPFYRDIPLALKISGPYNKVIEFIKVLEDLPNVSEIRRANFYSRNQENPEYPNWYQSGEIIVELDLVIFSDKAPDVALAGVKGQMDRWAVGRNNAFQSAPPLSPLAEITIPPVNPDDGD